MRWPWLEGRRQPSPEVADSRKKRPALDLRAIERAADREAEAEWTRRVNEGGDEVERWLKRRRGPWW